MSAETILLTAFSVLFAIIGFLIVDKLKNIDRSLSQLRDEIKDQRDEISGHEVRLSVLESEHKIQHQL